MEKKFITKFYRCSPDTDGHTISKLVKIRKSVCSSLRISLVAVQSFAVLEARQTFPCGTYLVVTSYCGTRFICTDMVHVL